MSSLNESGSQQSGPAADLLRELEVSAGWPHEVIESLRRIAAVEEHPGGRVLFRQGEPAVAIYYITSGRVAVEVHVPARGTVRLLTLGRGDLLGWSPLLGGDAVTATAIALDPLKLVAFPGAELSQLCETDHQVGYLVMRSLARALAQRLSATRLQLLDLYSPESPRIELNSEGVVAP